MLVMSLPTMLGAWNAVFGPMGSLENLMMGQAPRKVVALVSAAHWTVPNSAIPNCREKLPHQTKSCDAVQATGNVCHTLTSHGLTKASYVLRRFDLFPLRKFRRGHTRG
jgi:hypothetical protein